MKTIKMTILFVSMLTFQLLSADAFAGHPRWRGHNSVKPATVKVKVKTHRFCGTTGSVRHHDDRCWTYERLSKKDKKRAQRLANYTGIKKARFLKMRVNGYRWRQIAERLDIHPRVVRAARTAESWRDFRRALHRCGNG